MDTEEPNNTTHNIPAPISTENKDIPKLKAAIKEF